MLSICSALSLSIFCFLGEKCPVCCVSILKKSGKLLVLGWGGTYGAIRSAVVKAQAKGCSVSHLHLRYINPFPLNLGEILVNYESSWMTGNIIRVDGGEDITG